ncbi:YoaK family protein [Ligilactobacillus ceti]|nr:YoaK family protein [Ligilactobacillus ceti]
MSESILLAMFLAIGGGFRDAYSYNVRGHVFANAQTGNLVLLSQALARQEWQVAFKFVFPILAFIVGIYITDLIKFAFQNSKKIHWRQIILILEILMLGGVGLIPMEANHFANVIISLACAMQVEGFRNFLGLPMATTMCTGNLRSGTALLSAYTTTKNPLNLKQSHYYYFVVTMFCIGAGLGAVTSDWWGGKSIWLDAVIMVIAFGLMFRKRANFIKIK